jgi:hypothetical protein
VARISIDQRIERDSLLVHDVCQGSRAHYAR